METVLFNDNLIKEYSKKIYGFAYSKTRNIFDAEDLSQEILLSLADSLKTQREIVDLDGFIYTISYYTWSKFLRKNKKHWDNLDVDEMYELNGNTNLLNDCILKDDIEKLHKEIACLSKLHRQITIMFYYENKSGEEISRILNIPHSTIRWHLTEIRKKLKEGIEMSNENLSYTPKRLQVGLDGFAPNGQAGLTTNLLSQNIAIACYGEALTIEEISRKLGVAAAYLENLINDLLFMDYLKVVDKNKYQTNFFIREPKHTILQAKYQYENISEIAKKIFNSLDKRYEDIKAIGFTGCDLDKDFVLWSLIPLYTNETFYDVFGKMLSESNVIRPKHKDGTEHWVSASLIDDNYFENSNTPKEVIDFIKKSRGNGIKSMNTALNVKSLQLESYVSIKLRIYWRNFEDAELNELYRIKQIIDTKEKANENDKLLISKMVDLGYVKMENECPRIMIPFFDKEQYAKLRIIIEEIKKELGEDLFSDYINNFAEMFEKHIPKFISKEERYYLSHGIYPQYAVLFYLTDNGYLRYPTDEEAKRICTVLWCE